MTTKRPDMKGSDGEGKFSYDGGQNGNRVIKVKLGNLTVYGEFSTELVGLKMNVKTFIEEVLGVRG